jgi:hypothetical protein
MMVVKLTKTFPIRITEWLLAGIMLSWSFACWNLTPGEWDGPFYALLDRLAPQQTWAFIAFCIAFLRLSALTINGAWRPSPHLRAAGAFLSLFIWLQVALATLVSPIGSTAVAIYPWLLLADTYNVFRASYDARLSDDRASKRGRQNADDTAA